MFLSVVLFSIFLMSWSFRIVGFVQALRPSKSPEDALLHIYVYVHVCVVANGLCVSPRPARSPALGLRLILLLREVVDRKLKREDDPPNAT